MKNLILFVLIFFSCMSLSATTVSVTTSTYTSAYSSASDGDTLLLDAGTYSTALNFPVGKVITLKKLPAATSIPSLTFTWTTTSVPTSGSGLVLDSISIAPSANYLMDLASTSIIAKIVFKNCTITNVNRCIIKATNSGISVDNITFNNCVINGCGSGAYCLVYFRQIIGSLSIYNCTMYNYAGEGFFLAQTNTQTNTFTFDMHNNTIYNSGRDGSFAWCNIAVTYASTCTYNISNNIFNKSYNTVNSRKLFIVPSGSGTVTSKNNLFVDCANYTSGPAAGWDSINLLSTTLNYFKDTANRDFTLASTFPYRGTDGNYLGAVRWWPSSTPSNVNTIEESSLQINVINGIVTVTSDNIISEIDLYSSNGSRVISKKYNDNLVEVNADNLPEGVYIVKVSSKESVITKKILISK